MIETFTNTYARMVHTMIPTKEPFLTAIVILLASVLIHYQTCGDHNSDIPLTEFSNSAFNVLSVLSNLK